MNTTTVTNFTLFGYTPCFKIGTCDFLQIRDYRKCAFEQGPGSTPTHGSVIVNKVCLKMSLENVVKDIPLISDNSWAYGDLMVSKLMSPILSK